MSRITERFFRRLPDFRGKRRVGRVLFASHLLHAKDEEIQGRYGCTYKLPNLQESVAYDIFVNGIYEKETHKFLHDRIDSNGIFLDLGANIGAITIPLCTTRADIKVFAVEAAPWIYEYLSGNVRKNELSTRVTCINKALTDISGQQLPFYSPQGKFGKGSLSPVFTQTATIVETITVSDLIAQHDIQKVSLIKIDIEGFELLAFKGAADLLSGSDAPDILFEFVDWAEERAGLEPGSAQKFLLHCGYRLYAFDERDELKQMDSIVTKGGHLLFASKKM